MGSSQGICPWVTVLLMRKSWWESFWVGCGWFFFTRRGVKRNHQDTHCRVVFVGDTRTGQTRTLVLLDTIVSDTSPLSWSSCFPSWVCTSLLSWLVYFPRWSCDSLLPWSWCLSGYVSSGVWSFPFVIVNNESLTSDCGKRVFLGIHFYNYCDNYYFSFCTRMVTCWYKNNICQNNCTSKFRRRHVFLQSTY